MYNYREAMRNDITTWIEDNFDYIPQFESIDEFAEYLIDELWIEDSVTGNASGSYTFSSYEAKQCIDGNLDLLAEAFREFDSTTQLVDLIEEERFEDMDVTIRCYLLSEICWNVAEESGEKFIAA